MLDLMMYQCFFSNLKRFFFLNSWIISKIQIRYIAILVHIINSPYRTLLLHIRLAVLLPNVKRNATSKLSEMHSIS